MLPERTFTNPAMRRKQSAGRCRILLRKRNYRAGVYQARAWGNSTGVIVEKGISCGHGTGRCKDKLQMVVQGKPPLTEKDTEVRIESPSVIFQYQYHIPLAPSIYGTEPSHLLGEGRAGLAGKRPAGPQDGIAGEAGPPAPSPHPQPPLRRHEKTAPPPRRSSLQGSAES